MSNILQGHWGTTFHLWQAVCVLVLKLYCSWHSPGKCDEYKWKLVWLINLKDHNNTTQISKPFDRCSKRQYYWMRNKEQYKHTLSCNCSSRIGLLANPLDVHYPGPSHLKTASRLNPQWPGWGGWESWVEGDVFCMAHWAQLHTWRIMQDHLHPIFSSRAHICFPSKYNFPKNTNPIQWPSKWVNGLYVCFYDWTRLPTHLGTSCFFHIKIEHMG